MGAVYKRCLLDLGIFLPPFPYLQSNNDINFTSIPLFYRPLLWIGPRYVLANWSGKSCATPYLSVRSHCFTSHMLWRKEANIVPPVSNFTLLQMLLISPCWSLPRTPSGVCYRGLISFHRPKFPQTRKQITSDTFFGHSVTHQMDMSLVPLIYT